MIYYIFLIFLLVLAAFFLLTKGIYEKPCCSVIITDLDSKDVAPLILAAKLLNGDNIYVVTNRCDEKYFSYLEKRFYIREVLKIADGDY